ncbi:MAG: hypothetical protein MI864_14700 [Pseudomonadales bacterium]|nr:hypothetical protein [Pseudomonadales bacterium]
MKKLIALILTGLSVNVAAATVESCSGVVSPADLDVNTVLTTRSSENCLTDQKPLRDRIEASLRQRCMKSADGERATNSDLLGHHKSQVAQPFLKSRDGRLLVADSNSIRDWDWYYLSLATAHDDAPCAAAPQAPQAKNVAQFKQAVEKIKALAENPLVVQSVNRQNQSNADLNKYDLFAMDAHWRDETSRLGKALRGTLQRKAVNQYLEQLVGQSEGSIKMITLMDQKGVSVAQSDLSEDFWQGDESRFIQAFFNGPDTLVIESNQMSGAQSQPKSISVTITDPDSSEAIGVVTIDFTPSYGRFVVGL